VQFHVRRFGASVIIVLATFLIFGALVSLATPAQTFAADRTISAAQSVGGALRARRLISIPFGIDEMQALQADGRQIDVTGPLKDYSPCPPLADSYEIHVSVTQDSTGAEAEGETGGAWSCSDLKEYGWEATATAVTANSFEPGDAHVCAIAVVRGNGLGEGRRVVGYLRWCKDVTLFND
jgi:hypothetical protein